MERGEGKEIRKGRRKRKLKERENDAGEENKENGRSVKKIRRRKMKNRESERRKENKEKENEKGTN